MTELATESARQEMNAKVLNLAAQLLALPTSASEGEMQQVDLLHEHNLINGMYARSLHIPAGVTLTGEKHKTDHLNICIGDISVTTDSGVNRLTGVHVLETKAGMVRAGWTHSDTIWITIVRTAFTSLSDVPLIEAEMVENPTNLMSQRLALSGSRQGELCHSL